MESGTGRRAGAGGGRRTPPGGKKRRGRSGTASGKKRGRRSDHGALRDWVLKLNKNPLLKICIMRLQFFSGFEKTHGFQILFGPTWHLSL